eukprot:2745511-Amphidinium_carterae.1
MGLSLWCTFQQVFKCLDDLRRRRKLLLNMSAKAVSSSLKEVVQQVCSCSDGIYFEWVFRAELLAVAHAPEECNPNKSCQ